MTVSHDGFTFDWFGYATLRIETPDGFVVYMDPGRYGVLTGEWTPDTDGVGHPAGVDYNAQDGDLVCVTHDHHYDSDGIARVAREDATIILYEGVTPENIARDVLALEDLPFDIHHIGTNETFEGAAGTIRTVPAYNHPDGPHTRSDGTPFHPEGFGCGYLLECDETSVLWPGDSDVLDIHESIHPTVFVPPIGGSFTMDRHEAADLAVRLDPDLVLPIHYNTFAALETESNAFVDALEQQGVPVVIDEE